MRRDCISNVQRSRLQWRYIQLMLHKNTFDVKSFIEDVESAGISWGESIGALPKDIELSNVDFSKAPTKWI